MTGSKCIIFAFRTLRESADSVLHPVLAEGLATTGDDLVGIGLMSDIEDNFVLWGIVNIMKAHHQLYCTEARSKVPRIHGAAFYHILPEFLAELPELIHAEILDVLWRIHTLQKFI